MNDYSFFFCFVIHIRFKNCVHIIFSVVYYIVNLFIYKYSDSYKFIPERITFILYLNIKNKIESTITIIIIQHIRVTHVYLLMSVIN